MSGERLEDHWSSGFIFSFADLEILIAFQMVATELKEKIDSVADLLMLPWILNKTFSLFRSSVTSLVNGVNKYHSFMTVMKQKTTVNNQMEEPVRSLDDNFSIQVFERTLVVKPEYTALNQAVTQLDNYKPLDLCNFEPTDKEVR